MLLVGYGVVLLAGDLPDRRARRSHRRSRSADRDQRLTVLPTLPMIYWGAAVLPALFLAFFLLRGIRAIGPVLLVFLIFAMCGAAAGVVTVSTPAGMKVVVAILIPLGLFSSAGAVLFAAIAGMVLFVPFGWIAVDLIRRGYEARYLSDTSIVFDSIWLFQTMSLFRLLFQRVPAEPLGSRSARSSSTSSAPGSDCGW